MATSKRPPSRAKIMYDATVRRTLNASDLLVQGFLRAWPHVRTFDLTLPTVSVLVACVAVPAYSYGAFLPVILGTSAFYLASQLLLLVASVWIARRWAFVARPSKEGDRLVMLRVKDVSDGKPHWKPPQVVRWDILAALTSSWFGKVAEVPLPSLLRTPLYTAYALMAKANLEEAGAPLKSYKSLQAFFTRALKPGVRPISSALLTSPVDGTVVVCGRVHGDKLEQVKGVTYSLSQFLGRDHASLQVNTGESNAAGIADLINNDAKERSDDNQSLYSNPTLDSDGTDLESLDSDTIPMVLGQEIDVPEAQDVLSCQRPVSEVTALFHCVIYLAPGDYHRIHSPANISVSNVRHFPGTVFPISPVVARLIPGLFALNERVVMSGGWEFGHFSYVAVGAYNVGSIEINFDKDVKTNRTRRDFRCPNVGLFSWGGANCFAYDRHYPDVKLSKGEEVGTFKLGSTVVLIFEAPQNFRFCVEPNQKVKLGQPLGDTQDSAGKPFNYGG